MNISQGSLEEFCCYLLLSKDLGYGDSQPPQTLLEEISKLLDAYLKALLSPKP